MDISSVSEAILGSRPDNANLGNWCLSIMSISLWAFTQWENFSRCKKGRYILETIHVVLKSECIPSSIWERLQYAPPNEGADLLFSHGVPQSLARKSPITVWPVLHPSAFPSSAFGPCCLSSLFRTLGLFGRSLALVDTGPVLFLKVTLQQEWYDLRTRAVFNSSSFPEHWSALSSSKYPLPHSIAPINIFPSRVYLTLGILAPTGST